MKSRKERRTRYGDGLELTLLARVSADGPI
jgi:hypothetical protein